MLENKLLGIHSDLLRVRAKRAEVIAKNLANSNTPNYKAVDINIESSIKKINKLSSIVRTTNENHIGSLSGKNLAMEIQYRTPNQISLDGNTVESDQEIIRLSENNIRYQYSLKYASDKIKMINEILKDI
jgi:flagellar basal-body rod protein FlgB